MELILESEADCVQPRLYMWPWEVPGREYMTLTPTLVQGYKNVSNRPRRLRRGEWGPWEELAVRTRRVELQVTLSVRSRRLEGWIILGREPFLTPPGYGGRSWWLWLHGCGLREG